MSRYPPGGALPPLQWGGEAPGRTSSRSSSRHHHNSGRRSGGELNDHSPRGIPAHGQFTDDMSNGGVGLWQDHHHRDMQSVNMAVKKLSAEIEALEHQLHSTETASQYTTNSVKSLEVQHVGSVNDLRSRVGRCDASIAKLSSDMRQIFESVAFFNQQLKQTNSLFTKATTDLDAKISKVETQIKEQVSEHKTKLQSVQDASKKEQTQLDDKTRNHIIELQKTIDNLQRSRESDVKNLQDKLVTQMGDANSTQNQKLVVLESQLANRLDSLEKRLDHMESTFTQQLDLITKSQQELPDRLQAKLNEKIDKSEVCLRVGMEEAIKRSDHGLTSLQESLETMRALLEGKQKLLAEEIRKEMGKVKKMVILT